jgi:hypothetical protein
VGRLVSRLVFGFLTVLIVAGVFFYLQTRSALPTGKVAPKVTIGTLAVENELLAIANAERQHFALEGKYADLADLEAKTGFKIAPSDRAPYTYSAAFNDADFRITATYNGPPDTGAPLSMWIDQTMQIQRQ